MTFAKIKDRNTFQVTMFFIWPFYSFIYSIINYRSWYSRNIIWLFTAFFGLTMVIPGEGWDAFRFAQSFSHIANSDIPFFESFKYLYKDSNYLDIYETLLISIISNLTDNWRVFYAIVGLIYGYFYSRNIWYVIDRINGRITIFQALFILTFSFIIAIYSFQFVRFSTATHVFMFGVMPYLFEKKKKNLYWAVIAILIHFTFIFPFALFIVYIYLPKKTYIYFYLFIFTSFVFELKLSAITSFLTTYLPFDLLQEKVNMYSNEGYATRVKESLASRNWYIIYRGKLLTYLIYALVIYIFTYERNKLLKNEGYRQLFEFSLLLFSAGNLVSIMPSGSRFLGVATLFLFAFFSLAIGKIKLTPILKFINAFSVFVLVIYCIVGVRYAVDIMGIATLFGNPVVALFIDETVPIIDYIKLLF